jgi:glycosyltransferase involved in cell wall biosynthesis
MSKKLPIAVIITTFNSEKFIEDAINSVLNQTKCPEEIIAIDNGSTDSTESIIQKYGIRLESQITGQVGASRNMGIKLCKSPIIKFLDADDLLEPDALESLYNAYLSSPSELIYGKIVNLVDTRDNDLKHTNFMHTQLPVLVMTTLSSIVSREVFLKYRFPEQDNYSWNYWYVNAKSQGLEILRIDKVIGKRRIHEQNISHDQAAKAELFKLIALNLKKKNEN